MFKKSSIIILIAFTVLYWGSRIVHAESDAPNWKIFYYSQVDELFYTIGAFDNGLAPGSPYEQVSRNDFLPLNLFEVGFTKISLAVLGNNYIGLRFPSMLMGYLILLMFWSLMNRRFGWWPAVIASIVLLTDTGFLLSNRLAEPTIFRLFGMLLTILYLVGLARQRLTGLKFFLAGAIGCFAFLFFYPTNFFVAAATFLILLILYILNKKQLKYAPGMWWWYCVSSGLVLIIFLLICKQMMGNLSNFSTIGDFSGRVAVNGEKTIFTTLKSFGSNVKGIINASFFMNNYYMLALAVLSIACFVLTSVRVFIKNKLIGVDQVMLVFLLLFLGQTVFVNDYPRKKLLILFPFVIYSIVYSINWLQQEYKQAGFKYAYLLLLPVVIMSTSLQIKHVYSNPTYYYKSAMLSMRKYDGKLLAGNLSYAFRLYNRYIPLLNYYAYRYHNNTEYQRWMMKMKGDTRYAGTIFYGSNATLKEVEDLKNLSFCVGDTLLATNPNFPKLPVFVHRPCNFTSR